MALTVEGKGSKSARSTYIFVVKCRYCCDCRGQETNVVCNGNANNVGCTEFCDASLEIGRWEKTTCSFYNRRYDASMVATMNVSVFAGHAEESVLVVAMTANSRSWEIVCRLPWLATREDAFEGDCVSIRRTYSR